MALSAAFVTAGWSLTTRRSAQRATLALLAAMSLLAAACSSSEEQRAEVDGTSGRDPDAPEIDSLVASPGPDESPVESDNFASPQSDGTTALGGATPAAPPSGEGNGATRAERDIPYGKGVTADTISIGITYLEEGSEDQFNAIFGTGMIETAGTGRDFAQAIIDRLNAEGGIGARQIKPVYYEHTVANLLSAEGRRRGEQEMCAQFTEDHQVFAMIPWVSVEGVITQCAADTDTPMVAVTEIDSGVDQERLSEIARWWYRPNWFTAERRERAFVTRLTAQGFFGRDAKVGIMVQDKPAYRRGVERALKPALAEAGVAVVAEATFPDFLTSPWETYVLQFRQAGVTHVLWAHCGCSSSAPGLFMRAAEDQQWRPLYGLASEYQLGPLVDLWAPANQLEGARGIGWFPLADRWTQYKTDGPITGADAQCRMIMSDADFPEESGGTYCEGLFFLKAGVDRASALTSAGLASAVEQLGGAYIPPTTPAAFFGAGRHDGAAAVWDVAFDSRCPCFVYTAGPHSVP